MKSKIIIILSIAFIIFFIKIVINYIKNYKNEIEEENLLINIQENLNSENMKKENEFIENKDKGYEIEGIIEIPKINIKYPIINQTNETTLKLSITKFDGKKINKYGNYTLAGHNNKDGTMFGKIKYLSIGDVISLKSLKNETIEYEIFKIYTVKPNDVSCTKGIEPDKKEVTLITCTNASKNRLIIKAREIL